PLTSSSRTPPSSTLFPYTTLFRSGLRVYLQNPPSIRIGGQLTKSLYQYTLVSPDTDQLYKYAQLMNDKMRNLPGLIDVTTDLQIDRKSTRLNSSHRTISYAVFCLK